MSLAFYLFSFLMAFLVPLPGGLKTFSVVQWNSDVSQGTDVKFSEIALYVHLYLYELKYTLKLCIALAF